MVATPRVISNHDQLEAGTLGPCSLLTVPICEVLAGFAAAFARAVLVLAVVFLVANFLLVVVFATFTVSACSISTEALAEPGVGALVQDQPSPVRPQLRFDFALP